MAIVEKVLSKTLDNQLIIDAKTKRLLLAEVYVHKRPNLATDSSKVDLFEVFHIYEVDDGESKIIPKLSTNCTDPEKIIEVLKSFTGSDTPQLKRLIDKLCAQSKQIENRERSKQVHLGNELNNEIALNMESARKNRSICAGQNEKNDFGHHDKSIESLISERKSISSNTANEQTDKVMIDESTNKRIKLWNHVISHPDKNLNDSFELLVVKGKNEPVHSMATTESESVSTNRSSLKIGQVFGSVNDEFVKKLLTDRTKSEQMINQTANATQKRLIQTTANLNNSCNVNDVQTARKKTATSNKCITISKHEVDLRCNFCLILFEKRDSLKSHLFTEHGYRYVCDNCFEPFILRSLYESHLAETSSVPCEINASRPYICIVDPPVILLKNNQVHAFKCKHCKLAFFNQKNYVKHAQKHSTSFRCKRCHSSNPISTEQMILHLANCDKR